MDKPQTITSPTEKKKLGLTADIACSIGTRIKEAREEKSKTHKQIATKIRVKESYLEAIELGNWDLLPVGVNGRGFIRLYARELGVSLPEFDEFSQSKSQYQVLAEDYEKVVAVKSKKEAKKKQKKSSLKKVGPEDLSEPKLIIDDLNSKVCLIGQNAAERGSIIEELNEELNGSTEEKKRKDEEGVRLGHKISTHLKKIFLFSFFICFLSGIFIIFNDNFSLHTVSQTLFDTKTKISSVFESNDAIVVVPEQPIAPTTENLNQGAPAATQLQEQAKPQEQAQTQLQEQAKPQEQAQTQLQEQAKPQEQAQTQLQEQAKPQEQEVQTPALQNPAGVVERIAKVDILSPVEIKIRVDGKNIFSGIHEAGVLELSLTKEAEISVADGSKIKLNYGNWDLGVLGTPGRKRKIILNANSYQE